MEMLRCRITNSRKVLLLIERHQEKLKSQKEKKDFVLSSTMRKNEGVYIEALQLIQRSLSLACKKVNEFAGLDQAMLLLMRVKNC